MNALLALFLLSLASSGQMDVRDKNSFSISDTDSLAVHARTPPLRRGRPSAAAHAIALRRQSFGEIGETPPRPRLVSVPCTSTPSTVTGGLPSSSDCRSALTNSPNLSPVPPQHSCQPAPLPTPPPVTHLPTSNDPSETDSDADITDITDPPSPDSPRTNRSGKKRRLTQNESGKKQRKKMGDSKKTTGKDKDEEDPFNKLAKLIKGLEGRIEQSETRTAIKIDNKIDGLGDALGGRLDKVERDVTSLAASVSTVSSDLEDVKARTSEEGLKKLVSEIVLKENPRRPRPFAPPDRPGSIRPSSSTDATQLREDRYLKARRQLRLWPVREVEGNLCAGVRLFLQEKLGVDETFVRSITLEATPVLSRANSPAQSQVVVTFGSSRERDDIRSRASGLRAGDRSVGCQLEPPDHLRGHYQAFQNLAFCLKKKNPSLKRNIKFDDKDMTLVMDIKIEEDWKTVHYAAVKNMLKNKSGSSALSRQQLRNILSNSDVADGTDEDDDDTMTDETVINKNNKRSPHSISFINTNARSLTPKIRSLADCFQEKLLDFAAITETWFQSSSDKENFLSDLTGEYSLKAITRDRASTATNGRQYGGIALIFRQLTSSFEEFPLSNPDNFEVLAAVGSITGIKGKIFLVICYAPPNLPAAKARSLIEYLSDIVCEAKRTYEDCTVSVMGDFNQWSTNDLLDDHPDLTEINYGPTRGDRSIDRTFCNFGRSVVESKTLAPLETDDSSRPSDHKIAFAKAVFQKKKLETLTYTHRPYTGRGADRFVDEISKQEWVSVLNAEGSDQKADEFQRLLSNIFEKCFPLKKVTKRKDEHPWVNHVIRKLSAKRRRVYDREGRSPRWKALKKKSDELYRTRAETYMNNQKNKFTGPDASRNFFRNFRSLRSREKPPEFNVRDLFPEKSESEVAEELAGHFNEISKEFDGLEQGQVPQAHSDPLPIICRAQLEKVLCGFKKPKSMVPGDIFPALVNRVAPWISSPLADIYNCITNTHVWPSNWKVEFVTPIPKKSLPQSPNDLRNISCTKLFSKVYESYILAWLSPQAPLRSNQFGGVKGLGTEHFLVNLWQNILENLDDPRAGSLITSIDYSKAFNRLDFSCCLKALQEKGVCQELLNIVASFLTGRTMTVKVGSSFSAHRTVEGGVPQGSLLGVLLFNTTIDSFEAFLPGVEKYGPQPADVLGPPDLASFPPIAPDLPPITTRDHKHLPQFMETLLQILKYVDDNVVHEKINFDKITTDGHSVRDYFAARTHNAFGHILTRAEFCGMKVNSSKTLSLLVSEVKSYLPKAHFYDPEGNMIRAGDNMKMLGFRFSSTPDMSAHVSEIKRKFRSRMWALRHLGHRGFSSDDLLRVYLSTIVPCHDYCSVVYHSSLTGQQSDALERLQAQALKCIYGYDYSYRALLERTGIPTLRERREARCDKFAFKCASSERFNHWFPREANARPVRDRNMYKEFKARTCRLMNSPVYDLRRRLNRVCRQ